MSKIINNKYWHYLLIYTAISFGGMALPVFVGRELFILITTTIGIYYCIINNAFERNKLIQFVIIFTLSLLIPFLASDLSIGSLLSISGCLFFSYSVIICNKNLFLKRFLNVVLFISIISLILFSLTRIFGVGLFSPLFPYLTKVDSNTLESGVYSYGGFIYRWTTVHELRNCGPFGEPGQFQGVISVALYFSLFKQHCFKSIKERKIFILIYTLTMLTTLSTNGYIAISILYISYLFCIKDDIIITKFIKRLLLFTILIFIFTDIGKDFIKIAIYDKFFDNGNFSLTSNTTGGRTKGIIEIIEYISNNPSVLIGIGYDNLENLKFDTVSGLPKLIIAIGLIPMFVLLKGIIHLSYKYAQYKYEYITILLLFISMGLGQPHIMNPSIFFMIFYNALAYKKNYYLKL